MDNYIIHLGQVKEIVYMIRLYFINLCTYYMIFKIMNISIQKSWKNIVSTVSIILLITVICCLIREWSNFLYLVISMIILISILFKIKMKNSLVHSMIVTMISLSINYIIFIISTFVSFIIILIFNLRNEYFNMAILLIIYIILILNFSKVKRLKKGLAFLQSKFKNEYFDLLILNISCVILFTIVILSNYDQLISKKLTLALIILAIMMFVTIQKSLQLYYKQRKNWKKRKLK